MKDFTVINPVISGTLKTDIKANSSDDAAKEFWTSISKYIVNDVPKYTFTLQGGGGKLYHYEVTEKVTKGGKVDFKLNKLKVKLNSKQKEIFLDAVKDARAQSGGKKRYEKDDDDDSSSSSDSDSEIERKIKKAMRKNKSLTGAPLDYIWYTPDLYPSVTQYIPTYISTLSPVTVVSSLVPSGFYRI